MPLALVDSHCHIPMLGESVDIDQLLQDAAELGVTRMLCVAVGLEGHQEIINIAEKYSQIDASVGIHPNANMQNEDSIERLVELASNQQVIAIGETGLDYFRSSGDMQWQQQRFRNHIQVAKTLHKPLIIHSRAAADDTIKILQQEKAETVGGVMHCFVEDWQVAQQAIALNFYISFSGIVTFKNAKQVQAVARQVPLDRMLVETDSPYLAPVPYRGKQNQPGYTRYVAEFIAELRGIAVEELAKQTTDNYYHLFQIQ